MMKLGLKVEVVQELKEIIFNYFSERKAVQEVEFLDYLEISNCCYYLFFYVDLNQEFERIKITEVTTKQVIIEEEYDFINIIRFVEQVIIPVYSFEVFKELLQITKLVASQFKRSFKHSETLSELDYLELFFKLEKEIVSYLDYSNLKCFKLLFSRALVLQEK